jgi:hypothetical protein
VLQSRSHKEPRHLGGAGAEMRCGSSSKLNIEHRWIIKNFTNCNSFLRFSSTFITISIITNSKDKIANPHCSTFVCVQRVSLLYTAVEKEPEPEPHQKIYPEPEPHKNDATPQHCFQVGKIPSTFL